MCIFYGIYCSLAVPEWMIYHARELFIKTLLSPTTEVTTVITLYHTNCVNSLRSIDAYRQQGNGSSLVQVMAYCPLVAKWIKPLFEPLTYSQSVNLVIGNKPQSNFNQNTNIYWKCCQKTFCFSTNVLTFGKWFQDIMVRSLGQTAKLCMTSF